MDRKKAAERIATLEARIRKEQEELAELRRNTLRERVEDHSLLGPSSETVRLGELFAGRRDLIVIHNMGKSCPYCTLWADGFNGILPQLEDRAAFAVVTPDPPAEQQRFARDRGWRFRIYSDAQSEFTEAMGYLRDHDGKRTHWPGLSTFVREEHGALYRIAHASFGPGDPYCALWHLIALLERGADGWTPRIDDPGAR